MGVVGAVYERVKVRSSWAKRPFEPGIIRPRLDEPGLREPQPPIRALFMANWKDIDKDPSGILNYVTHLNMALAQLKRGTEAVIESDVVVAPIFTSLQTLSVILNRPVYKSVQLGSQDVHWTEEKKRFTGDVPASSLALLRVKMCIVGHSERREHHNETDADVNRKAQALLEAGISPVICVGESFKPEKPQSPSDQDVRRACEFIGEQLFRSLIEGRSPAQLGGCVVAYEPVWAIGSSISASPEYAEMICFLIRAAVEGAAGIDIAAKFRIQYGGSVKPDNIASFMLQQNIDGALVGGASLDPISFANIVRRGIGYESYYPPY